MEYIVFIHGNVDTRTTEAQWSAFFEAAEKSGIFGGGSEIAEGHRLGHKDITPTTDSIVGVMRFETDDVTALNALLALHPVFIQGGSLEVCKMPKS